MCSQHATYIWNHADRAVAPQLLLLPSSGGCRPAMPLRLQQRRMPWSLPIVRTTPSRWLDYCAVVELCISRIA